MTLSMGVTQSSRSVELTKRSTGRTEAIMSERGAWWLAVTVLCLDFWLAVGFMVLVAVAG